MIDWIRSLGSARVTALVVALVLGAIAGITTILSWILERRKK